MECKRSGFGRSSNDDEGYIGHNTKNSNNDATTGPQESINEGKIPIRNLILLYIVCFLFEFSLCLVLPFFLLGLFASVGFFK